MNRFIFIVLSALLLTFSNSGLCNESGISGTARKMQFQSRLFEGDGDIKEFAITVPPDVAHFLIHNGYLTWSEVEQLMTTIDFRKNNRRGLKYEMVDIYFNKNINAWLVLFRPIKFL